MNSKLDKKVWLMWMEGRVHNEYKAIETPIGFIPKFGDLKALFKQIFDRDYSEAEYEEQFSLRLQKSLDKITRLEKVYLEEGSMPEEFMNHSKQEKARLEAAKEKFGKDIVSPAEFE